MGSTKTISEIFSDTIKELVETGYNGKQFFTERDFVWTVQKLLSGKLKAEGYTDYRVFNDYPMKWGEKRKRGICVDLAIVHKDIKSTAIRDGEDGKKAEFVAEFKFEPSPERGNPEHGDIPEHKVKEASVVSWPAGIEGDIVRVKEFVFGNKETKAKAKAKAKKAVAILIDEGSRYKGRKIKEARSSWRDDWKSCSEHNVSVLWTEFHAEAE